MIGPGFAEVIEGARRGDEAAFAAVWRDLQPSLLRYLRVAVGNAADDVASEVWLRAAEGLGAFVGDEAEFRSWFFTIARYRALDWHRREARRPTAPVPHEYLADRAASYDSAGAALDVISTESALALIARLPREQAEVVVLRAVAGLDVAQVAAIVGKRPSAVRVLGHRGLRRLAQLLSAPAEASRRVTQ